MTRSALALLGLLALPVAAAAQDRPVTSSDVPPQRLPESRFSVTPYVGARVPFTTGDIVFVDTAGKQSRIRYERGGGPMVGVDVTGRIAGPVHLVGGFAFSSARNDVLHYQNLATGDTTTLEGPGPRVWFAKAGVQVRLADPTPDERRYHPSAFITVAPALVWTDWGDITGLPAAANRSSHHWAVNAGADAVTRIGRSAQWALLLGVQDYLVFWNTSDLAARDAALGATLAGAPVAVNYTSSSNNLITLRLGVSYRIR
jgi:hypothetical protein